MGENRSSRLLPGVAALILCVVAADLVRRSLHPTPLALAPAAAADSSTLGGGTEPGADTLGLAQRRRVARVRERIEADAAGSYLAETVRDADSTVRRWPDERIRTPLRVAITRQQVEGFREDFVSDVVWAVGRWNGVVPVQLDTGADSANADIVVVWTRQLDSNRTGRTDLTWDRRGLIHHATIVLATHSPDGRLLDARRMSALALHEMGHALGLNHSPDRDDVLHPIAYASELSARDRLTARALYQLPPGSIR